MVRLRLPVDGWDAAAALGGLLMAYGAWLIYAPAGIFVAGAVLVCLGLLGAARSPREREP